MNTLLLEKLCFRMQEIAKEAGTFIQNERHLLTSEMIEEKGFNDLCTYVDTETEKLLVSRLHRLLPEAGFITEEKTAEPGDKNIFWVIDPLDGTNNYLHGYPDYAVTFALMEERKVMAGVTYHIPTGEMYYAWKQGGAYCNKKRIRVSKNKQLSRSLLIPGFPYNLDDKADIYLDILKKLLQTTHGLRSSGSSAVDLSRVASGKADAYFEFNLYLYDIAAGIILVNEAGGMVSDFFGGDKFWNAEEVMAAGSIHPELIQFFREHWKRSGIKK